jgi:hypothetical protein
MTGWAITHRCPRFARFRLNNDESRLAAASW